MAQPRALSDDDQPEPPHVRRLRLMVSLLMVVLIVGMVAVVAVMVIRLGTFGGTLPAPLRPVTADHLSLPKGAEIVAIGQGASGVLVVTRDGAGGEMMRVLDPSSGAETSATPIRRE